MRKTVLSLLCALSLLLTLTSCGKEPEAAQSPQSVLEAAGGLSAEETLLTVDGREVAAWQYLYWLAEVTDGIRSYYEGAQKPLDWSEPLEDVYKRQEYCHGSGAKRCHFSVRGRLHPGTF